MLPVLNHEHSSGAEESTSGERKCPDQIKPVRPTIEGGRGIKVGNFRIARNCIVGDIRRIRNDHIHPGQLRQTIRHVASYQLDPAITVAGDVSFGPYPSIGRFLDRPHVSGGHFRGHCQSNRSTSRTEIYRTGVTAGHGPKRIDGELDDELGFWTRHKYAWPNGELELAKRRHAGEVLERLTLRPPAGQLRKLIQFLRGEFAADNAVRLDLAARTVKHKRCEQLRINSSIQNAYSLKFCGGGISPGGERCHRAQP